MKEQVKEAIFNYFREIGRQGGLPVRPGNLLVRSVKSNLPHELKGYYELAVEELVDAGFLSYRPAEPVSPTKLLGSTAGYAITGKGVSQL